MKFVNYFVASTLQKREDTSLDFSVLMWKAEDVKYVKVKVKLLLVCNSWQMYIYPEKFTYRLTREGREFRVDFDLTKPVPAPPAPWGYTD